MDKDPTNYELITYFWVLLIATWGGMAHNIKKIKTGDIKRFSIAEMIGDIVIAGFIGIMTFFLCEYADLPQILTAAFVGITGHQGTRGMAFIEKLIASRFSVNVTINDKEES